MAEEADALSQPVTSLFNAREMPSLKTWASAVEGIAAVCETRGLSAPAASSRAAMAASCARALIEGGAAAERPARAFHVPGRVELFGKHTDYAGGRSLLAAVERGFVVVASPRQDRRFTVRLVSVHGQTGAEAGPPAGAGAVANDGAGGAGGEATGALCETWLEPPAEASPAEDDLAQLARDGCWSLYPITAARRLARNFGPDLVPVGADLALAGDLPPASGLSSSSALITATALGFAASTGLAAAPAFVSTVPTLESLSEYLGCVENGQTYTPGPTAGTRTPLEGDLGVGTFGGSEDHAAIICCRPGRAEQFAFCPVRHERSVCAGRHGGYSSGNGSDSGAAFELVVGASGHLARKAAGARADYNRASACATAVLNAWQYHTGRVDHSLWAALSSSAHAPALLRDALLNGSSSGTGEGPAEGGRDGCSGSGEFAANELVARADQFWRESAHLVPRASNALAAGNATELGAAAAESHALGETSLCNQVAETRLLVRLAHECGALAASAFGAGFGGSVWALASKGQGNALAEDWEASYRVALRHSGANGTPGAGLDAGGRASSTDQLDPTAADRCCFFVSAFGVGAFEMLVSDS